jgi:hypothetical protein
MFALERTEFRLFRRVSPKGSPQLSALIGVYQAHHAHHALCLWMTKKKEAAADEHDERRWRNTVTMI